MALFLRGDTWWYELRTRSRRIQRSTGLKRKERKRAAAVYEAARMAFRGQASRPAVEAMLDEIYGGGQAAAKDCASLSAVNEAYERWKDAKGRSVAARTDGYRRRCVDRFTAWAEKRGLKSVRQVTAEAARDYALAMRASGVSNKTQRNALATLSAVWNALAATAPNIHNPWPGVIPDKDGSAVRRGCFTPEQEAAVLAECEKAGRGWWLASMISRYTALRYGDVARLDWSQVDMGARRIAVTPSKTARHGIALTIPIVDALFDALAQTPENDREGWVLPVHAVHYPKPPPGGGFADILRRCGLDPKVYTFHSWRHTCASRLSESGASVEMLRRFGGWTSDRMAEHYDHAERLDEMRAAMERTRNYTECSRT